MEGMYLSERISRAGWEPGPWNEEKDKYEWRYKNTPCLIVRGPMGALCGYAGVSEGHPWFEKDYNDIPVDVHWGLTYGDHCSEGFICHEPLPGESDNIYWLGFDCAHSGDITPGRNFNWDSYDASYKNVDFVKAEVESLVDQILEVATSG